MASPSDDQVSSDEKDGFIIHFREICAEDDVNVARSYLRRCGWDLEEAVQNYLAEKDSDTSSTSDGVRQLTSNNSSAHQQAASTTVRSQSRHLASAFRAVNDGTLNRRNDRHFGPQGSNPGWTAWIWSIVTLPVKFFFVTLHDIWNFLFRILFNYDRAITNPAEDVDKFVRDYEQTYGVEHPVFYRGTYSQALVDARKELKFLIVYLHCETHRDTSTFCRSTLSNRNVRELLNTRALFWACSVKSREGYKVSQAMHETTYPFLAAVCCRENRMMIVARQEGYFDANNFVSFLNVVFADNEVHLNLARQERLNQRQNQVLREQQEQAFQESLQRDREKERLKEEQVRREQEILESEKRQKDLLQKMRQTLSEKRLQIRHSLPPEPPLNNESGVDVLRVSVKFPSGARFERRFSATDSLLDLFHCIMAQEDCPECFSVFTVLPRQILVSAKLLQEDWNQMRPDFRFETFNDAGLHRSATLIVQDDDA